ncbi:MAG: TIR domain-containing protein [Candidatus Electryonea clarkiae]|nr:TIR domain-containing protein [Candidatus Electryonea clarkiae]
MSSSKKHPLVFVSYSHKDNDFKNDLTTFLSAFELHDNLEYWIDDRLRTGDDWKEKIETAMAEGVVAVVMLSIHFLTSKFIMEEEWPYLLGQHKKGKLQLYPIMVSPCPNVIKELGRLQYIPSGSNLKKIKAEKGDGYDKILTEISGEINNIYKKMVSGDYDIQAQTTHKTVSTSGLETTPAISTHRLPTTDRKVFGRDSVLDQLDNYWNSGTHTVATVIAPGGVGKSALVNCWLNRLHERGYRGMDGIYGWSFYSQGVREEQHAANSEAFQIDFAKWLGVEFPEGADAYKKAELLADKVQKRKMLLILDGLEPLQNLQGELRDKSLAVFLKMLASENSGVCLITSRVHLADLKSIEDKFIGRLDLEALSIPDGVELLKHLGVKGLDRELEDVIKRFGGHALSLNLLGSLLFERYGGDVRHAGEIKLLPRDPKDKDDSRCHAFTVVKAYVDWFGVDDSRTEALLLLGLFDRPAEAQAIAKIRKAPAIKGMTEHINSEAMSSEEWNSILARLRRAGLLLPGDRNHPGALDAHPLVREYFDDWLQNENKTAWQEGHRRLYKYYQSVPEKDLPDTIEEMQPLYAAVVHGCRAGEYQEALDEVYFRRIKRKSVAYNVKKLGAFGSDLTMLAGFFTESWTEIAGDLSLSDQGYILNQTSFALRALGRLGESQPPIEAALVIAVKNKNWANASRSASTLSEMYLANGKISSAVDFAEEAVKHTEEAKDEFQVYAMMTTLADALHQAGEVEKALDLFEEAEELQKKHQPQFKYLYSLQGYQYCDLILSTGNVDEVRRRFEESLEISKRNDWLLDIGFAHLVEGRALSVRTEESGNGWAKASEHLDEALVYLRKSGMYNFIPLGLIARAEMLRLRCQEGDADRAWVDLEEALEMTRRSELKLFLADSLLEATRLHLKQENITEAEKTFTEAAKMVSDMGYHRRDKEVEKLRKQLGL